MSKQQIGWAVVCLGVGAAAPAWGETASIGAKASSDTGVATHADAHADDDAGTHFDPYTPGNPPDHNLLEIGVFGGVLLPSADHNLRDWTLPQQPYLNGPEVGARLGYFPLSFLGVEGEAMGALSRLKSDRSRAVLYAGRGSLVLQIPLRYVAPFALGGAGKLAAISVNEGADSDVAWHFGVGVKIPLTHIVSLRLEGRDNLTPKTGDNGKAQAHTFEALFGLTAVIERAHKEPPALPTDSDHDGVVDHDDQCPSEPGVAPEGCPSDSDGDGILDRDDYCPKEKGPKPRGCRVVDMDSDEDGVPMPCDLCPDDVGVKPDGCPVKDSDSDGVLDDRDKCPHEPETKNGFEDDDGCPDKVPEKFKRFTGVVQGIYFDQSKSTIRNQSNATLAGAVKVLLEYPSVRLEISGHTSSEGDQAFNDKLSQERADAVKTWLVERGVDPNRITTRGAGSQQPIADNKSNAGRSKNRRIEFKILQ